MKADIQGGSLTRLALGYFIASYYLMDITTFQIKRLDVLARQEKLRRKSCESK
jgi:hypothetical protein